MFDRSKAALQQEDIHLFRDQSGQAYQLTPLEDKFLLSQANPENELIVVTPNITSTYQS